MPKVKRYSESLADLLAGQSPRVWKSLFLPMEITNRILNYLIILKAGSVLLITFVWGD